MDHQLTLHKGRSMSVADSKTAASLRDDGARMNDATIPVSRGTREERRGEVLAHLDADCT